MMQDLVAELCDELGHEQLDNLSMSYRKRDGSFATVTRHVSLKELRGSRMLRLAPGSHPARSQGTALRAKGRSGKYAGV